MGKKLIKGEEIPGPKIEGYLERGIRVNYFHEKRGSERAVDLLVKKMKGEECETEYPMPVFDRVPPNPPVEDVSKIKIAVVISGGIVPQGNPDHIESSSATKYGIYSIEGMDHMNPADFMTIHGGYDRAFVSQEPDLVVPLDVLREMEGEGVIGELANHFITTTGTGTSTGNAKGFGKDFVKKLLDDQVGAVILTIGANRIVPAVGIPYPLGDPNLPKEASKNIRRELVERGLKALMTPIEEQTVFES